MAQASSFGGRALGWLIGLAGVSLFLALLLTAFADDLGDPESSGPNGFSRSALGHRAFLGFLERIGMEVSLRRTDRISMLSPDTLALALDPPPRSTETNDDDPFQRLIDGAEAAQAPVLITAPKWAPAQLSTNPRFLRRVALIPANIATSTLSPFDEDLAVIRRRTPTTCKAGDRAFRVELRSAQLFMQSDEFEVLAECDGYPLAVLLDEAWGEGPVYALSDPDLLNNHGLGRAEHADLLHDLLVRQIGLSTIIVDETIHGFQRSDSLLEEMVRFPLAFVTIHVSILLGLLVWGGFRRFGKPRKVGEALDQGKRILVDNTANLLTLAAEHGESLRLYHRYCMRDVARYYYLAPDLPHDQVVARLADIGGSRGVTESIERLDREIRELIKTRQRKPDRTVRLGARLDQWRNEMTDVG
ncbi:hypothetical protein ABI59_09940 [Acidobacteria bacterium Mor1]|nr:hypothetical protein ABI59_09940 [Acidobacteria bacterium Mor1]